AAGGALPRVARAVRDGGRRRAARARPPRRRAGRPPPRRAGGAPNGSAARPQPVPARGPLLGLARAQRDGRQLGRDAARPPRRAARRWARRLRRRRGALARGAARAAERPPARRVGGYCSDAIAFRMISAASPASAGFASSSGEWLTPSLHGTNTIAQGTRSA